MDFNEKIEALIEAINELRRIRNEAIESPDKLKSALSRLTIVYSDCESKLGRAIAMEHAVEAYSAWQSAPSTRLNKNDEETIGLFWLFQWHCLDIACRIFDSHEAFLRIALAPTGRALLPI